MQTNIKEKFSDAIQVLKKEFQNRQKKGKLPSDATDLLKFWWEKNFHWPYPAVSSFFPPFRNAVSDPFNTFTTQEEDKDYFCKETGLSKTQINNWFINQRKRHWHKVRT